MREREGAVVLLPDSRRDARTVRQWLSIPAETEVLLEKAARLAVEPPLPPISASELLTFGASPGTQVITRESGHRPVVTVTPYGGGRLVLSGALDAWRYRAEDNAAFDRFWQALIAGIAMAAPPAIDIEVEPAVIAPGDRAEVRVRVRRTAAGIGPADTVAVDGAKQGSAIASFIVAPDAHVPRPSGPSLSLLAESHGGIDVTPDTLSDLERRLRRDVSAPPAPVERRPMRSAWWIIPFAGCLSAEWWLRRRRGLK